MSVRWTGVVTFAAVIMAAPASAQWLKYPTPGMPRTPDGKPNLSAPAPRTADGKPKLAGLWITQGIYIGDITKDLKPGEVPFQPWAEALYKQRRATESKDDPTGRCIPGGVPRSTAVPYPFKIVQGEDLVVILYEAVHSFRQIFTDGRPLPKDPNPNWLGYSIGRWERDEFVVESSGFKEENWLDNFGHPATERLHVIERFRRKDFGHMDVEVTIDDPKAYTKPWKVTLPLVFSADNEILEYVCVENEKDYDRLQGR
jgi:hypothetical protein